MRTLRVALAGTVTLGLLGGLGNAIVAQSQETGPMAFPTGTFISEQESSRLLEFRDDSIAFYRDPANGWDYPWTYAVDGDLFTRFDIDLRGVVKPEGTWRWEYDGERLAFPELVSGVGGYAFDDTYRPIEDPRIVVVAATDIEAGKPILDWQLHRGFAPVAEVFPKLYLDPAEFIGTVPLEPIAKGQPITPALVLPAE